MTTLKPQSLPEDLTALVQGQIRITRLIAGRTGSGAWWRPDDKPILDDVIASCNERYGCGSHWIETCGNPAQDKP